MSPRISFSNDFIDSSTTSSHHQQQMMNNQRSYRDAPVSSDFEFSVTNYSMISADELFCKGRLLPFKESSCSSGLTQKTTIRDELLNDDDFTLRIPKSGSTRWKGLLGLKRSHVGSKKIDKKNEEKRSEEHGIKNSQEVYNGSGSGGDMEFRFK
ncbi:hypothetical protein RND71_011528 [Anisodus tanguticus]|uniref:Uncharacterized protein n=1 Tax=Anisodus tanguticus TaxID=243964 RepID=A0AAE1VKZ5_9SOLA|nr:hypothetical protein RND71_011528 [Anisodus tanguticus]